MSDQETKTSEHQLLLEAVLKWSKAIEAVPCIERGAPVEEPFTAMCSKMLEQALDMLNQLTTPASKIAVLRLITELLRDRKHWFDKVVNKAKTQSHIDYSIRTIKSRTLSSALGFISGVLAVTIDSELDEKEVPWVHMPIGGCGPAWVFTEEQLRKREIHSKNMALRNPPPWALPSKVLEEEPPASKTLHSKVQPVASLALCSKKPTWADRVLRSV